MLENRVGGHFSPSQGSTRVKRHSKQDTSWFQGHPGEGIMEIRQEMDERLSKLLKKWSRVHYFTYNGHQAQDWAFNLFSKVSESVFWTFLENRL